jgi:hypothetical protein
MILGSVHDEAENALVKRRLLSANEQMFGAVLNRYP